MSNVTEKKPSNVNEMPLNIGEGSLVKPSSVPFETVYHSGNSRRYARNRAASRKRKWWNSLTPERRKEISRRDSTRIRENLTDGYIRGIIANARRIDREQITPEMIEAKRQSLQAKRTRKLVKSIIG
jgi:hypothetical protein